MNSLKRFFSAKATVGLFEQVLAVRKPLIRVWNGTGRLKPHANSSLYADWKASITKTVRALHDDVKSSGSNHETSISELKEQLKALSASIATERNLTKQVADLQMMKVELDAKLNVTDNDLKRARQQAATAGDKERELLKQVADLESSAAAIGREPAESPATARRLIEIASQNESIQKHLIALKSASSESSSELVRMLEVRIFGPLTFAFVIFSKLQDMSWEIFIREPCAVTQRSPLIGKADLTIINRISLICSFTRKILSLKSMKNAQR